MKTILTIWILTFFTLGIYSQEIKRVNTKDLITISNNFGLDSALHLSHGFPIYKIDSITALELLDKMTSYERYTPSEYFFNAMAHNWINEKVKSTTERLAIQQLNDIKSAKRNDHKRLVVFDDKLMISILQQHIRIEPQLISCYNFCDSLARDQRKNYPSFFSSNTSCIYC